MEAAVTAILDRHPDWRYRPILLDTPDGKARFLELCVRHLGQAAVFRRRELLPVPALFLDGVLAFTRIPDEDALTAALQSPTRHTT